jgi:hypothetical protein
MEKISDAEIALQWTAAIQGRIIRDLAAAFGRHDRGAALDMIATIERFLADELQQQFPERVIPVEVRNMVVMLRQNLIDAKEAVNQAAKPN